MPPPLSIVFLDPHEWDYNAETPFRRPLGGTQSAACHLAIALAARGHRAALSTHTTEPGSHRGVECVGREPGRDVRWLGQFDIVVVPGTGMSRQLRPALPATTRIVLWTGFTPNLKVMRHLADPAEQAGWDGIAFGSIWQMRRFRESFGLPPSACRVLRLGAAPAFRALPDRQAAPGDAPVFLHTSAPERGLALLLDAWPAIRGALPGARLVVTSSRLPYQIEAAADEFRPLYERARATEGVDYVGALAQPDLAARAASCAALLYPATFAETACLAAIEAMAAGLRVVATDLGALPETCAGHAALVRGDDDRQKLAQRFAATVVADMQRARADPAAFVAQRVVQQRFVRAVYDWDRLAVAWAEWLLALRQAPARALQVSQPRAAETGIAVS